MAATGHAFPNLEPSQRVYTPAVYPQKEFPGLNGIGNNTAVRGKAGRFKAPNDLYQHCG